MRSYKIAGIFLLIFALLLGAYFLYNNFFKKNHVSENTENKPIKKLNLIKDKIKEVQIGYNSQKIILTKKGDKLELNSPVIQSPNEARINQIYDTLPILAFENLIEKESKNLSQFGLVEPKASIDISTTDGKTVSLIIGSLTPSKDLYYAKQSTNNDVYTISNVNIDSFLIDTESLTSK